MTINKDLLQSMEAIMSQGQGPRTIYGPGMDGASAGMAFLIGELEKQDPRLLEPLTSITAPRDIIMKPGGGWVSNTSNIFVDYATTGDDEDAIIGGQTTDIPISQADLTKDLYKVHTFAEVLKLPIFDDFKMQQIGRSLSQMLDDGVRLNYNKILDRNVYRGITKTNTFGLVNNPAIASALAPAGVGGLRTWISKTPDEILADVNALINLTWAQSQYDLTGMANHILIDPVNYAYIVGTKVSLAGDKSILTYLLENNIAKNQGRDLQIFPSRWCLGAGVGPTNRMVGYVNAENRVCMDLTVPLSRVLTAPNVRGGSIETLYAAQIGQVKFLYTQCARYMDGI
jgi:hypothetical protein